MTTQVSALKAADRKSKGREMEKRTPAIERTSEKNSIRAPEIQLLVT